MTPFSSSYNGFRLLAFIKESCRSGPCREHNHDLSKLFGVHQNTITRWIARLHKEQAILRCLETEKWYDAGGEKRYRKHRRIYVVSNVSIDQGAVLVANAVAALEHRPPLNWSD